MRRYFVTGLLIWVPLGITLWVISTLVGAMDSLLLLLPPSARPTEVLGGNGRFEALPVRGIR